MKREEKQLSNWIMGSYALFLSLILGGMISSAVSFRIVESCSQVVQYEEMIKDCEKITKEDLNKFKIYSYERPWGQEVFVLETPSWPFYITVPPFKEEKFANLLQDEISYVVPLVIKKGDKNHIIGTAYRYTVLNSEGEYIEYYLTPLHNIAGQKGDIFVLNRFFGVLFKIGSFSLPKSSKIDYYQDLAILSISKEPDGTPKAEHWKFEEPHERGTYVNLGFHHHESNINVPNGYSESFHSLSKREGDLLSLNSAGQSNAASGGVILGVGQETPLGLVLCMNAKENLTFGIKFSSLEKDFLKNLFDPKNFAPTKGDIEYTFVYKERDGCEPIGDRGILGDIRPYWLTSPPAKESPWK